jgi:hypothetical protein
MKTMAVIAIVGLAVTGCSSSKDNKATTAAPVSSTTTSSGPKSFSTVASLKDAAVAAGLACPTWTQDNVVESAAESGTCSDDTVLSTYATTADLQSALDTLRSINQLMREKKLEPTPLLIGTNWIINAPSAASLTAALGGTIER